MKELVGGLIRKLSSPLDGYREDLFCKPVLA